MVKKKKLRWSHQTYCINESDLKESDLKVFTYFKLFVSTMDKIAQLNQKPDAEICLGTDLLSNGCCFNLKYVHDCLL